MAMLVLAFSFAGYAAAQKRTLAAEAALEILQGKNRNIQFGDYKWRLLDIQGDKALLITEDVIETRPYNKQYTDVIWETCDLREYLNGEFLQKFTAEQRGKIAETNLPNPNNLWYGTPGGNDTFDKIFLLSLEEVDWYFGNSGDYQNKMRKKYDNGKWVGVADSDGYAFSNDNDSERQTKIIDGTLFWWLRSPGYSNLRAAGVRDIGAVDVGGSAVNRAGGVCPALWLNLK